ncbi:MAG: hypothetical protein NT165_03220 [Candidatus Falkowbacteria bacterium]|nr:hypothetical protein [Candidatus Falkowbacteria bacterium]
MGTKNGVDDALQLYSKVMGKNEDISSLDDIEIYSKFTAIKCIVTDFEGLKKPALISKIVIWASIGQERFGNHGFLLNLSVITEDKDRMLPIAKSRTGCEKIFETSRSELKITKSKDGSTSFEIDFDSENDLSIITELCKLAISEFNENLPEEEKLLIHIKNL